MATRKEDMKQFGDSRSAMQIVKEIADDTSTLVRKEVELARTEIVEAVSARIKAVGAFGAAGTLALMGFFFLCASGAAALSLVMPVWTAALVIGGTILLIAGIVAAFGRSRMKRPSFKPEETVRTVKEDVEWTKDLLKR